MMASAWRSVPVLLLAFLVASSFTAVWWWPVSYTEQTRTLVNQRPSTSAPLGTDALGRDRLARLAYGTRVSLLLAPAAALLSTALAALMGGLSARRGWIGWLLSVLIDLVLCLPWLFLLLTIRALLPLQVSPWTSVSLTFALLGCLGWAIPARVVRVRVQQAWDSDWMRHLRALGTPWHKLLFVQLWPNLRPVLVAQFLLTLPAFVLSEANLGVLGLGVVEPLPSLGNLLRDLQRPGLLVAEPWLLAPALLLMAALACLQGLLSKEEL